MTLLTPFRKNAVGEIADELSVVINKVSHMLMEVWVPGHIQEGVHGFFRRREGELGVQQVAAATRKSAAEASKGCEISLGKITENLKDNFICKIRETTCTYCCQINQCLGYSQGSSKIVYM